MAEGMDQDEGMTEKEIAKVEIPGFASFSDYVTEGYKTVMGGVKTSGSLPSGRNYQFYQTYTNFREKIREKLSHIQEVMEDILEREGVKGSVRDVTMEDALDTMMSVNDKLLDRATRYMDLMEGVKTGLNEAVEEISGSWNKQKKIKPQNFTLSIRKNIPRPQFTFKDKVDNSNSTWEPIIKDKPNALRPLAILLETSEDGDECFSHPYEYELEMWEVPDRQLVRSPVEKPPPVEQTPYTFVQTEDELAQLVNYLDTQRAIAVDLEHHNYRSFLGFTCLVQISTSERDYIVDALALRHALHSLNQIFTKPTILKVFHGADSDVVWLQRDFGVYLVNMLDTYHAAKLLALPKLSLAYLLQRYCNIDANKHFQLFDWRTRPMPDAAVKYAREDTHYLLYIAQVMSNELLDKANGSTNILKAAYEQSRQVCNKRFEKPLVDGESYMNVYRKGKRYFDNRQLFALKALYLWRDKTARELDESLAYVFPDAMMLNVAENLPREVQGILACCNPVPPLVKANLLEIHYLLIRAKEQPLVKVIAENTTGQGVTKTAGMRAEQQLLEQWYHPTQDLRDDLPTLLGTSDADHDNSLDSDTEVSLKDRPFLSIFDKKDEWYNLNEEGTERDAGVVERLEGLHFTSPYQRYVKVLPYSAQLDKEMREAEIKSAEEHKQRSREQQSLAMEIKTLEESGLIKLKKEDENKETMKIMLSMEKRKRHESERSKSFKRKKHIKVESAQATPKEEPSEPISLDSDPSYPEGSSDNRTPPTNWTAFKGHHQQQQQAQGNRQKRQRNRQKNMPNRIPNLLDIQTSMPDVLPVPATQTAAPTNLLNFRTQTNPPVIKAEPGTKQQTSGGLKSLMDFDYSKVDFASMFSSGVKPAEVALPGKKKKWKSNPGAKKFMKKKKIV